MPCIALTMPTLKRVILAAADLREKSFDNETLFYKLNEQDAANLACLLTNVDLEFAPMLALLLNDHCWNDTLVWAGDHKGRKPEISIPPGYIFPPRNPFITD